MDEPSGYDTYKCLDHQDYCDVYGYDDVWYEHFRAACRKTCNTCQGKQCTTYNNPYDVYCSQNAFK